MSKILLVTGASSDIGIELIRNIEKEYEKILVHYCNWSEKLENLKQDYGNKLVFLQADFYNINDVKGIVEKIQNDNIYPDHFVHLPAPKILTQKFLKTTVDDFEAGWIVSVQSAIIITQGIIKSMEKKKNGKIIFMLSSVIHGAPPKYQTAYITVKNALLGLMKSLAVEYAEKGIRVNSVSPDMINTKFLNELPDLLIQQYAQQLPDKKILEVEDIIPTFAFLLSDGANKFNGENIVIKP